mmetsp:Transcript_809/g.1839  ORF Transcript_809/g.1839 Transcript_809/m.1839 type:complete len:266 (+) Transcript_809:99-896(+)
MGQACLRDVEDAGAIGYTAVVQPGQRAKAYLNSPRQDHSPDAEEYGASGGSRPQKMLPKERWSALRSSTVAPTKVLLHIYDVGTSSVMRGINSFLRPLGTGVFHCGVEVYGVEWSYSDIIMASSRDPGSGVFCSRPRDCEGHAYTESVVMGETQVSEGEVLALIDLLRKEWPVSSYHTLRCNCCHFSDELCERLGVGRIPSWVLSLATAGAAVCAAAQGDIICSQRQGSQAMGFVAGHHSCCCPAREDRAQTVELIDASEPSYQL